ncbi:MAG: acetate--CoA ligase family protein [Hyphomicrobiaceae bacterium]
MWPKSVALIGASPDTGNLRGRTGEILCSYPFAGPIYPISRSHKEVHGRRAYASVADVPEPFDLAVLIIPAEHVPAELERCAAAGVRAALIMSSGFAEEPGGTGARLQDEVRRIAQRYDIAVCGPNSAGLCNLESALCPTFSPAMLDRDGPLLPRAGAPGRVAVVAQSGGLSFAFFDRGRPKDLAFNYIVTTGNEACLAVFDVVEHLLDEGRTDAFILLIEDIKNAETFRRTAEKAARAGKPLLVNKIGQSEAGKQAALSHTAALAGNSRAYRAMFERYGIVEGGDIEELVDIAQGFIAYGTRLPAGKRVGICTGSGGAGGWMADTCVAAGLEVPELDAQTRAHIDTHLPAYGSSRNPVDATAQTINKIGYGGLAELVAASPLVDGVIVVATARASHRYESDRANLARTAQQTAKPILFWTYTLPAPQSVTVLRDSGYPLYTDMRSCVRTMAAMADYRAFRERFLKPIAANVEDEPRRRQVAAALQAAGPVLTETEAKPLLAAYGIGKDRGDRLVGSAEEAVAAAASLGGRVALKVQSPDILHKTNAGAVALGLNSPEDVRAAYHRIVQSALRHEPSARILGVLVQPMAPPGRETILGARRDPLFGPLLMIGLGGIHVEILKDVVFSPVPVAPDEVLVLLTRLRSAALLVGFDIAMFADTVVRLSRFAADHADIVAEIDLNPVIVHPEGQGVSIVDAVIVRS